MTPLNHDPRRSNVWTSCWPEDRYTITPFRLAFAVSIFDNALKQKSHIALWQHLAETFYALPSTFDAD